MESTNSQFPANFSSAPIRIQSVSPDTPMSMHNQVSQQNNESPNNYPTGCQNHTTRRQNKWRYRHSHQSDINSVNNQTPATSVRSSEQSKQKFMYVILF